MALATFNKHFGKYGEIVDSVIMKDRFTGQPRGFGFITYADPSVVDKVIEDTHVINGKQVKFWVLFSSFSTDFVNLPIRISKSLVLQLDLPLPQVIACHIMNTC